MKVKCQCQTKLYWHTATPIYFHMDRAFFCASRTELAICCRDRAAHKAEKHDSLAFYRKRLSTSDPENCLIKEETSSSATPREGTGASGGSCRGTACSSCGAQLRPQQRPWIVPSLCDVRDLLGNPRLPWFAFPHLFATSSLRIYPPCPHPLPAFTSPAHPSPNDWSCFRDSTTQSLLPPHHALIGKRCPNKVPQTRWLKTTGIDSPV